MVRGGFLGLLLAGIGCAVEGPGSMSAVGSWSDGEAIQFSADAHASRDGSRVQTWARSFSDARFRGLRISYDPRVVTAPGRYPLDPAVLGALEVYCLRPDANAPDRDIVEFEASSGFVTIDRLPDPASARLEGTFDEVLLRRDQIILQLSRGRFEVDVP